MQKTGPRRNGNTSSKKQLRQWRQQHVLDMVAADMMDEQQPLDQDAPQKADVRQP